jgi:hypothetical protein
VDAEEAEQAQPAEDWLGTQGYLANLNPGLYTDIRLPGRGNLNSLGATPVHQIISTIKWIRTSRLAIKYSLSPPKTVHRTPENLNPILSSTNSVPEAAE